jgi:hypothetical protein
MPKFGGYTNIDLSNYPLKEPINIEAEEADNLVTGVLRDLNERPKRAKKQFTPESIGRAGGFNTTPKLVGTAEMVADECRVGLKRWELMGLILFVGSLFLPSSLSSPILLAKLNAKR